MKKLWARWVLHLLTLKQRRNRMRTSAGFLRLFKKNPADFLWCFVTMDKTWIDHNTLVIKHQSKQWTGREPALNNAKGVPSTGKAMASVFWDGKESSSLTILKRGKRSLGSITHLFWTDWRQRSRRNVWDWPKMDVTAWQSCATTVKKTAQVKFVRARRFDKGLVPGGVPSGIPIRWY